MRIVGSELRKGMLVVPVEGTHKGCRLLIEGVSGRSTYHVRQCRKDGQPDRRHGGWSGYFSPSEQFDVLELD